MATYPAGTFAPGSKSAGQTIQAAHVNDLQAEVTAIEDALRNGIAHNVSITGTLAVAGATTISTGGLTVSTGSVNIGGPSSLTTLSATASTVTTLRVTSTASFDGNVAMGGDLVVTGALTVGALTQSIPSVRLGLAADSEFAFNAEISPNWAVQNWSVGGMHSTTTASSRITFAHSTGLYMIGACMAIPNTAEKWRARFRFNDSTPLSVETGEGASSLTVHAITIVDTVRAASTADYVTVRFAAFNDAGSTTRILSSATTYSTLGFASFWAYKVG